MKTNQKILCLLLCLLTVFSTLSLSLEAAAVSVSATSKITVEPKADSVTMSWKKVSNATGYAIYKKTNGKWVKIKTQSSTKYTVKNLTASTNYELGVKAYRKYKGDTYWSKLKSIKTKTKAMASPKVPTLSATNDSVTLSWSKVSGATGYAIYQYKSNSWVKIKTTTSTKYTVKSLKNNTTYKFRIKPYAKTDKGTVWGKNSSTASIKTATLKTPTVTATAAKSSVTLKWGKVSGATGYAVYQHNGKSWVKIKTTSETKYTVKSLKTETTYKFMVKAYAKKNGGTIWSKSSKSVSAKTYDPTKTKITSITSTETSVTVKWSKVSGATGYRLYVRKNGEWSSVKTTSSLSYTVKKLKPATSYTYAVKAYKKVDGKVTWYAMSSSKTIKTKANEPQVPSTEPTTTQPTTTDPTTTEPTTTKPTTTQPTTTKLTTTKPTTTKPTTTKPTTTKPTTTKPTTTKPTTTKPTTTKPTTTKPTTTKPTTTKPTTTKPTTTKPTTTQPTTHSPNELVAYRIEKYRKIFDNDTIYFKISSDNGSGGLGNIEYAQKGGNIYVKAVDEGMTARMYYDKKSDKMYAYFLLFYYEVPKAEWKDMGITDALDDMKIKNTGFITVSEEKFNGKSVICESYRDIKNGVTNKYYFDGETLIGIEKKYNSKSTITYVEAVSNTFDESILKRPTSGYTNISGLM